MRTLRSSTLAVAALAASVSALCISAQLLAQHEPEWVQQAVATQPAARRDHAMVFQPTNGKVLLFGGILASFTMSDETWQFTPFQPTSPVPPQGSWAVVNVSPRPSARERHAMVWDSNRNVAVLFGGYAGGLAYDEETWEWNGSAWAQKAPPVHPPGRASHAMAYDSLRQRVVLFGGRTFVGTQLADTSEYDGTTWTPRFPPAFPEPRSRHAMAYDSTRGVVVLFGGTAVTTSTWEYDGTTWTPRIPPYAPAPRMGAALAFDAVRDVTVLFGGVQYLQWNDTWEWNGSDWRQRSTGLPAPLPRADAGIAFDSLRGRTVLFGGQNYNVVRDDTWEYYFPSGYTTFGAGCLGSRGLAALGTNFAVPGLLGSSFGVTVANVPVNTLVVMITGLSRDQWNGAPLPVSLAALGMPGCDLYVSPDVLELLAASGTTASYTIQLPAEPTLLGLEFHQQALVLDAAAGNPFGAIVSNAGTIVIGN